VGDLDGKTRLAIPPGGVRRNLLRGKGAGEQLDLALLFGERDERHAIEQ
jgi:hypothetical protein